MALRLVYVVNHLKLSGCYIYIPPGSALRTSTFCPQSASRCMYGPQNKDSFFYHTALTDWCVYCAEQTECLHCLRFNFHV